MNIKKATNGMWLTQATLEDEVQRTFFTECAGFGDLDKLFIEVSEEYKQEWEQAHQENWREINEDEVPKEWLPQDDEIVNPEQ